MRFDWTIGESVTSLMVKIQNWISKLWKIFQISRLDELFLSKKFKLKKWISSSNDQKFLIWRKIFFIPSSNFLIHYQSSFRKVHKIHEIGLRFQSIFWTSTESTIFRFIFFEFYISSDCFCFSSILGFRRGYFHDRFELEPQKYDPNHINCYTILCGNTIVKVSNCEFDDWVILTGSQIAAGKLIFFKGPLNV